MAITGLEAGLLAGGGLLNFFGGLTGANNAAWGSYNNTILGQDQLRAQIAMGGLQANASARNAELQAMLGREAMQNANTQAGLDREYAYFLGPTKQYDLKNRATRKNITEFEDIRRAQNFKNMLSTQAAMNSPAQIAFEKRQLQNEVNKGLAGKFANFAPMFGAINMQPAINAFRGFS